MEQAHVILGVLSRVEPAADLAPVVFDSPHSGRDYPDDFRAAVPTTLLRVAEDAWLDELYAGIPALGAPLLCALFPRCYIDVNRDPSELDPSLLDSPWPHKLARSKKVTSGVGLVWKLVGPSRAVYDRKLGVAEIEARLQRYYRPYHDALASLLDRSVERFGAVWHVNCHSMPSIGGQNAPDPGKARPDFCVGDIDGRTCAPEFTDLVLTTLRGLGYEVRLNDPYKGAELVRRYGRPARRRHSIQIEISRHLYMDEARLEKTAGFARLKADLEKLAEAVIGFARGSLALQPEIRHSEPKPKRRTAS